MSRPFRDRASVLNDITEFLRHETNWSPHQEAVTPSQPLAARTVQGPVWPSDSSNVTQISPPRACQRWRKEKSSPVTTAWWFANSVQVYRPGTGSGECASIGLWPGRYRSGRHEDFHLRLVMWTTFRPDMAPSFERGQDW